MHGSGERKRSGDVVSLLMDVARIDPGATAGIGGHQDDIPGTTWTWSFTLEDERIMVEKFQMTSVWETAIPVRQTALDLSA